VASATLADFGHERSGAVDWLRWTLCAAIVLLAHTLAFLMLSRRPSDADLEAGSPVITVEFAPAPAAPPAPATELAPGPEQVQAEANRPREGTPVEARPVEQTQVEDKPVEEKPVKEEQRENTPVEERPLEDTPRDATQPPLPDVMRQAESDIVLPLAASAKLEPPVREVEQEPASAAAVPTAPPAAIAHAEVPVSPGAGEAAPSTAAIVTWQRLLSADLERHKRYPANAHGELGVATLSFSIDRNGHLVDRRITHSSGSEVLDREAIAAVERAQPFPLPPPGISDKYLTINVRIPFKR
jgi:protein TonB